MKNIILHPKTSSVLLSLFIVMGILSASVDAAQAASYLWIHNNYQMSDGVEGCTANIPDQSASTGPLTYDTGFVEFHGLQVRSKARADYGTLGFYAYASPCTGDDGTYADGSALFYDTFTISNPQLDGQQGNLWVWIDVEGDIPGSFLHPGVSAGAYWEVRMNDDWYSSVSSWDYSTSSGRETYHGYLARPRSFVYGQPFGMSISISGAASHASTIADYYNTLTMSLADSLVQDSLGNTVTGCTFTAESGHDYSVPEPATMLMLALGAFVLRRR